MTGTITHATFVISIVAVMCASFSTLAQRAAPEAGQKPFDVRQAREALAQNEKRIVTQLRDEALWHNASRREELHQVIALAGEMRSVEAVEPLVSHIEHQSADNTLHGMMTWPAHEALRKIGLPAVPHLIEVIRADTKEIEKERERPIPGASYWPLPRDHGHVIALAARTLVEIYGNSTVGIQMAELRLREEARKATGEAKQQLQAALKHIADMKGK